MTIRLPLTPNMARVALLLFFAAVICIGVLLAQYFQPIYLAVTVISATVLVAFIIQFDWINIELKCPKCKSMALLKNEYRDGPAGTKDYIVAACPNCKESVVI